MLSLLTLRPRNESFPRLLSPDYVFHRIRRQDFKHHLRTEYEAFDKEVLIVLDGEINLGLRSGVEQGFLLRGQGFDQPLLTLCYLCQQLGVNAVFLEVPGR